MAAIETACSFYGRAFAAAEVSGADFAADALNPAMLSMIARALIRDGAALLVISVDEMGGFSLLPAASWDVNGGPREAEWVYRADFQGPSRTESVSVPSAGVLHFRWAVSPARPWVGVSPARAAQVTASGLANLEKMIADESGGAFGYLLPIPPVDEGDESDPNSQFRTDLAKARGNTLTIASVALDEDNIGRVGARSQTVQRFGGSPPATISELRRDSADQILRRVRFVGGVVVEGI